MFLRGSFHSDILRSEVGVCVRSILDEAVDHDVRDADADDAAREEHDLFVYSTACGSGRETVCARESDE